ncbi:methyltransferase-like protein 7A [Protopterus annectens]|uniref:methyltransferase-like protein 7A n=1 Tax=Protopterus annectens TaxID=7888 RepID=UPI001CFA22D2|nr:methyltransferase-like protein 7A [Protopterus annectens]
MISTSTAALQLTVKLLLLPLWLLSFLGIWGPFSSLFFPYIMNCLAKEYSVKMIKRKRDLFFNLQDFPRHNAKLTVLEIGCGTGVNFQFYPKGSRVICVDRNRHFDKFLSENAKKYPHLQVEKVVSPAEDLNGVADGSVDAVVCTLVLCSVNNVQKVLNEVVRVLKPGGTFYFMEHVVADPSTWTYFFQQIIDPLWWYIADGCCLIRNTAKYLEESGFSDLKVRHMQAPLKLHLVRPHIVGYAVK